jgi:hypothetical protein
MWSDLPATDATDWSSVDFLNQFVSAINERITAPALNASPISVGTLSPVTTGQDVQLASLIRSWQQKIESLMAYYISPGDPTVDDSVIRLNFWSQRPLSAGNDWRVLAGLNSAGWTRKRPREIGTITSAGTDGWLAQASQRQSFGGSGTPGVMYRRAAGSWALVQDNYTIPDVVTSYGNCFPGDYLGPWVWNEMKSAITLMQVTPLTSLQEQKGFWTSSDTSSYANATSSLVSRLFNDWPIGAPNQNWPIGERNHVKNYGASLQFWQANAQFYRQVATIRGAGTKRVRIWAKGYMPPNSTFYEDFGTGIAEGVWTLIRDEYVSVGSTVAVPDRPFAVPTPFFAASIGNDEGHGYGLVPYGYVQHTFTYN